MHIDYAQEKTAANNNLSMPTNPPRHGTDGRGVKPPPVLFLFPWEKVLKGIEQ